MTEIEEKTGPLSRMVREGRIGLPLLCLDFDGVIHSYSSGWQGASIIPDPPVPGAIEFILKALAHFRVAIFSSRSETPSGIQAMRIWIGPHLLRELDRAGADEAWGEIEWPTSKPPAFLTIDDRAVTFLGWWPAPETLLAFKTWQQDGFIPLTKAPVIHPRTPAERQPFAWARDHGEGSCDFLTNQGPDRPDGEGWFPLYRDPA